MTGVSHHGALERMARHRHAGGYVALVLAGGYVEAGDRGRMRVEAGHAVIHGAHESHQDAFSSAGATVLNLPLPATGTEATLGVVDDPDAVARLAERDPRAAAELLHAMFRASSARLSDWPDLLAAALASGPDRHLADWADNMGIAPETLSRGFRRAYGTSPKRYRLEHRTLRAVRLLPGWHGSIAALAAETGFADQSHLTHAIVSLTGSTPNRLRVKSVQEAVREPS
ncbi:MAG: AraC family transcriptional regulator [Pseudomonadota bacterium]|jgi:AraC-like DNA-binding protein|uniref:Transcriptional regulator, AraC family n=1 Tax=hydrothermal vent metagenome TaxID=652676 RepID=A0A160TM54_9ZZZZ